VAFGLSNQWTLVRAYLQAVAWHAQNLRRTLQKRRYIQRLRSRNDLYVLKRMYFGLREFDLLLSFGLPTSSEMSNILF
jgi:hypothetical protein